MILLDTELGAAPARVHAPGPGELDPFDLPEGLPVAHGTEGLLWGLDVEWRPSPGVDAVGSWAPDFLVRTVQLAPTDDLVWVLRMDDPDQREIARAILADPGNTFASHTKADVHAVHAALGVDIADRSIDTHTLAVMAAPDDVPGQARLKPVADRFGMPELGRAEEGLDEVFDALYRAAHPEVGRRAVKASTMKSYGFATVPVDHPVFVLYAGLDALAARRLVRTLSMASQAPGHVLRAERWLTGQAVRLERAGCLVDRERLESVSQEIREREERAAEVVREHTGLKTTQNVKLQAWLGDHGIDWEAWPAHMRTEPTRTHPAGTPSLAKGNVAKLVAMAAELDPLGDVAQVAGAMAEHSEILDRLNRTTQVRAAMDQHGYVHPTLYTVGTVTSRMSSADPNMQNFSKSDPTMRGIFVFDENPEDPEYVGISCDFAQVEMRVTAAFAREQSMIDVIKSGGDLHQLTADLLRIPRQTAKTSNFLIGYGGSGRRLASQLKWTITEAEGRQIVKDYWTQYPAISALNQFMKQQSVVRLISGRNVPVGKAQHAALNYLVQGSSRELLVGAWRRFIRIAHQRGYVVRVWFPVHDELIIRARVDQAQAVAQLAEECMTFDLYGVPIEAEADILLDEYGISRWMSGDHARKIRIAREAA